MSKVKIQGNASGTAEFTIEAPNGSTNRTLTLPDQANGTVLTNGSIANFPVGSILQVVYYRDDTDTVVSSTSTWTNLPATIGSITAIGNNSRYLYHSLVGSEADNTASMFGFLRCMVDIDSAGYNAIADSASYFNVGVNTSVATSTTNYNVIYTSTASAGSVLSFQLQARANITGAHFFQPALTGYDASYDVECHGYIMEIAA